MSIQSLLSNQRILNGLPSGGGGSVSVLPPLSQLGNVISLPIQGTFSPTNNTLKGLNENELVWAIDLGNNNFIQPLVNNAGDVSLSLGDFLKTDASQLTLNTTSIGSVGQVLALSATPYSLDWINMGGGTLATNNLIITSLESLEPVYSFSFLSPSRLVANQNIVGSAKTLFFSTGQANLIFIRNTSSGGNIPAGSSLPLGLSGANFNALFPVPPLTSATGVATLEHAVGQISFGTITLTPTTLQFVFTTQYDIPALSYFTLGKVISTLTYF